MRAARDVGLDTVAEVVGWAEAVREWLSRWRQGRAESSWWSGVPWARARQSSSGRRRDEVEEVPGEPPSKPLSGAGAGDGLWGARGFLGVVASDQVRCPVGVGLLLTCCSWALSGVSLRLPGLFVGRRDEKGASPGGWPRPGARSTICSRRAGRPGALDEVRAGHEAETRRTRPSPGGRGGQGCPWTGRRRAGRSSGHRA